MYIKKLKVKYNLFFGNINFRIKEDFTKQEYEAWKVKEYKTWEKYNFNTHFSTHDWLAYIPLKIIYENESLNKKWNQLENNFWTKPIDKKGNRIKLLLYGTAAPDYPDLIKFNSHEIKVIKKSHYLRLDTPYQKSKKLCVIKEV